MIVGMPTYFDTTNLKRLIRWIEYGMLADMVIIMYTLIVEQTVSITGFIVLGVLAVAHIYLYKRYKYFESLNK